MNNNTNIEKLGFFALIGRTFGLAGTALNTIHNTIGAIDTTVSSLASVNESVLGVAVDKASDFRDEMSIESSIARAKLQITKAKADKEVSDILAELEA